MKEGDRVDVLEGSPLEGLEGTVLGIEAVDGVRHLVARVAVDREGDWLIPMDLLSLQKPRTRTQGYSEPR